MIPSAYNSFIASEAQLYLLPKSSKPLEGAGVFVAAGGGVAVPGAVPGVAPVTGVGVGIGVGIGVGVGSGPDGPPLLFSVVTVRLGPSMLQLPAASPAWTENSYPVPAKRPDTS